MDVTPVVDLRRKLRAAYERRAGGAGSTLTDFDERDLIEFADRAGFREVKLDYEASVRHGPQPSMDGERPSWTGFLNMAPKPPCPRSRGDRGRADARGGGALPRPPAAALRVRRADAALRRRVPPRGQVNRVAIVGTPGQGSRRSPASSAGAPASPVIHLDEHHFLPGWQRKPDDEWDSITDELLAGERWVMDGAFAMEKAVGRADTVVFLDFARGAGTWARSSGSRSRTWRPAPTSRRAARTSSTATSGAF